MFDVRRMDEFDYLTYGFRLKYTIEPARLELVIPAINRWTILIGELPNRSDNGYVDCRRLAPGILVRIVCCRTEPAYVAD